MKGAAIGHTHWPFLDGLRGLAILLVIPHNINAFNGADSIERIPAIVSHAGWIGVQIFFVLSGFLITHQLLRDRESSNYFSSFYIRRALRIFPLYYSALIVGLFIIPWIAHPSSFQTAPLSQQIWLWAFLSNWTQPFQDSTHLFAHFWSLAIEEQFYLLWPWAVLLCARGNRLMYLCLALAVISLLCRSLTIAMGLSQYVAYMLTVCRMDALATGAAAAWLLSRMQPRTYSPWMANLMWGVAVLALSVCALITHAFDTSDHITITIGYLVLALVTAAIILVCCASQRSILPAVTRRVLSARPLRAVGRYSYAMYVLHYPLLILAEAPLRSALKIVGLDDAFSFLAIFVGLTYLLGLASYQLVERHFLALKVHFVPRCNGGQVSISGS